MQDKEPADIYILDLLMDGKTGIDLGLEMRRSGGESEMYLPSA